MNLKCNYTILKTVLIIYQTGFQKYKYKIFGVLFWVLKFSFEIKFI